MKTIRSRWACRLLLGLSLTLLPSPLPAQPRKPPAAAPPARKPAPGKRPPPTSLPPAAPRAAPVALTAAQKAADAEAFKLVQQAGALLRDKRYDEAIEVGNKALAIREKALGPEHSSVLATVRYVAEFHEKKGDDRSALPLIERAAAATEKSKGPDAFETAVAIEHVARLYSKLGDHTRALPILERALAIHEKLGGPRGMMSTILLSEIGSLLLAKRDFDAAEARLNDLLQRYEAEHDHPTEAVIAQTLSRLAKVYVHKRRYADADRALTRALKLRMREGHYEIQALIEVGRLYEEMGLYGRAEPYFERARSIAEREVAPSSPELGFYLAELARVAAELGDYPRAEGLYLRALALQRPLPQDDIEIGVTKLGLGQLYTELGDLNSAESLLTEALAILEKRLKPTDPDVAVALSALADLRYRRGDHDGAIAGINRALVIDAALLGADDPKIALYQTRLGRIEAARGKLDAAEQLFQRALALREKVLGKGHPTVASSLGELGELRLRRGDAAGAESIYQRALAIAEKALGRDHPDVASSLSGLAATFLARGNVVAAVEGQARAADIEEHNLGLILAVGSEAQKRSFMAALAGSTDFTVSLHANAAPGEPAALRLGLTTILQRKGRVLDVMADALAVLRRRLPEADQPLLLQLAATRSAFASAALRGPGEASLELHRENLGHLAEEIQQIEAKMSARSASFLEQETPATIERVQAALPDDAALVEYFVYRPLSRPIAKDGGASSIAEAAAGPPRLIAYTLRASGQIRFVDLGPIAAVDGAIARLRKVLVAPTKGSVKEPARALDELVMRPVRGLLDGATRVLLSPDGALNVVPFAALVDEHGQFLIERFDFTYLTSGRDLLRRQLRSPSRSGSLLLANPAFGRAAGLDAAPATDRGARRSVSLAGALFPPLPGTASEARALSRILKDAELLIDIEATESALKKATAPRILHVATHGFFLPDQEATASPPDAPKRSLSLAEGAAAAALENPLLRSGLALSGANGRKSGSEDGILTALEATGLDLDGTDLVVLSACETGLGDVKNGDGVYGLRRALFLAGAATEVTSLWKVDDQATRDLMVSYYEKLEKGGGRSASLHEVQRALFAQKATSHPYYWASFVVSGDASPLEPRTALAVPKAPPSARGCACALSGEEHRESPLAWLFAAAVAWRRASARRRRRAELPRRTNPVPCLDA